MRNERKLKVGGVRKRENGWGWEEIGGMEKEKGEGERRRRKEMENGGRWEGKWMELGGKMVEVGREY